MFCSYNTILWVFIVHHNAKTVQRIAKERDKITEQDIGSLNTEEALRYYYKIRKSHSRIRKKLRQRDDSTRSLCHFVLEVLRTVSNLFAAHDPQINSYGQGLSDLIRYIVLADFIPHRALNLRWHADVGLRNPFVNSIILTTNLFFLSNINPSRKGINILGSVVLTIHWVL